MKISLLLGFSLSTCLLLTVLVAADTTEDIMDVTFEHLTAEATLAPPAPLGFIAYSADTGNLLFTTSQAADDPAIMREIGGAGNYIVIRTQDPNWCTDLTLDDCRKNAHFISETAFSLQEIPVETLAPSALEDIPSEDLWSPAIVPVTLPIDPLSLIEKDQPEEETSGTSVETETPPTSESWTEPALVSETSSDVVGEVSAETPPAIVPQTPPEASSETSSEAPLDTPSEPVPTPAPEPAPETSAASDAHEIALPEESPEAQEWTPSSPLPEEPSPDPMPNEEAL